MDKPVSPFNAARKALAEARSLFEIKDAVSVASDLKAHAMQTKDERLLVDAVELFMRAIRRLGEKMAEALDKGERAPRGKRGSEPPFLPSLKEQGVDKILAKRARKAFAMNEPKFEAALARAKRTAVAAISGVTRQTSQKSRTMAASSASLEEANS